MGKVVLARVDERLIHGQVMTQLSKKSGANAIFIVDDQTMNDDFLKQIFLSSGTRTGLKIKIFSEDSLITYWKETNFEKFNVILLARTIETFYKLIQAGVVIPSLNLGAVSKKSGTVSVIKTVSITHDQFGLLKELAEKHQVESYFQAIPSTKRVSMKDAEKAMKG